MDVEEEEEEEEEDDVEEEDRSQEQEAHFVGACACAVEMHMDMSQEPFCVEFNRKCAGRLSRGQCLCEPAQSKCTWTSHKSHFVRNFTGKVPDAYPGASVLRELAHSKCTHLQGKCQTLIPGPAFCANLRNRNAQWTGRKRHFVREFTGKNPDASDTTSIEHRPLTVTVRTPQCGHTAWGKTGPFCVELPPLQEDSSNCLFPSAILWSKFWTRLEVASCNFCKQTK